MVKSKKKTPDNADAKTERDFYRSLSQLAGHYCINPKETQHYGYPYNIALAMDDLRAQLKNNIRYWEDVTLVQEKGKTFLVTEERYNTGATLYYIPVVPLYRMLKNKKHRKPALLLLSICSYLYNIVDVPYYTKQNAYLNYMYEMTTEWLRCDDYNEDIPIYLNECKQAEWVGQIMEQKIFNYNNITIFKHRLESFESRGKLDTECLAIATEAFGLFEQYPNANIFRNVPNKKETEHDEDEEENIITMDRYISFFADSDGLLYQSVIEAVNTEFQEHTAMEEPGIIKRFDGNNTGENSLDFESRVFALIDNLIYILNNFNHLK